VFVAGGGGGRHKGRESFVDLTAPSILAHVLGMGEKARYLPMTGCGSPYHSIPAQRSSVTIESEFFDTRSVLFDGQLLHHSYTTPNGMDVRSHHLSQCLNSTLRDPLSMHKAAGCCFCVQL
jgi:hypothetical protein